MQFGKERLGMTRSGKLAVYSVKHKKPVRFMCKSGRVHERMKRRKEKSPDSKRGQQVIRYQQWKRGKWERISTHC